MDASTGSQGQPPWPSVTRDCLPLHATARQSLHSELWDSRTHGHECFIRYVFVFNISIQSKENPE